MKSNNVFQKPGLYDHTTLSDEVLVCWVILCKIDKLKEAKAKNWPSKDKNIKGKKKSPHDSKKKRYLYIQEYNKADASFKPNKEAKKKRWNELLWEMMEKKEPEKFKKLPLQNSQIDYDALIMLDEDPADW